MHDFAIDNCLVCTNPVMNCIRGVCTCSNLNLSPLLVGWNKTAFISESLEFLVDTLFFDAALSLDKGGF